MRLRYTDGRRPGRGVAEASGPIRVREAEAARGSGVVLIGATQVHGSPTAELKRSGRVGLAQSGCAVGGIGRFDGLGSKPSSQTESEKYRQI